MRNIVSLIIIAISFVCCTNHYDLVDKYGDLYLEDIKYANKYYDRVDSLINISYGDFAEWDYNTKREKRLGNLERLKSNYDYALFRFNYFTNDDYRKMVNHFLKAWGWFPYEGKYHNYAIDSKPSKSGRAFICLTHKIID